jgi:hypothetical protein
VDLPAQLSKLYAGASSAQALQGPSSLAAVQQQRPAAGAAADEGGVLQPGTPPRGGAAALDFDVDELLLWSRGAGLSA